MSQPFATISLSVFSHIHHRTVMSSAHLLSSQNQQRNLAVHIESPIMCCSMATHPQKRKSTDIACGLYWQVSWCVTIMRLDVSGPFMFLVATWAAWLSAMAGSYLSRGCWSCSNSLSFQWLHGRWQQVWQVSCYTLFRQEWQGTIHNKTATECHF